MLEEEISLQCQGRVLNLRQDPEANQQEVLDSYAGDEDEDLVCFVPKPGLVCAPEELPAALAAAMAGVARDDTDPAELDEQVVT